MNKDTEKTKVIFRMENYAMLDQWHPLAVFPALAGTSDPYTCSCYAHDGQHSSMSIDYMRETRPAKPSEFKALQEELEFLGYNLQIVKRFTRKDLESRKAQVQR